MTKETNMPTPETKLVKDIAGTFHIPSYQRGYRWGKEEVERLLNDINENGPKPHDMNPETKKPKNMYCLQPLVVKKLNDKEYELIDGQQRLTTLYLIYSYIHNHFQNLPSPAFQLEYNIRKTKEFLENLPAGNENVEEEIDSYFIYQAYQTIDTWFQNRDGDDYILTFRPFLQYIQVIWYEPEESEDSISLFTRLNIGKIPLTNAELVKALFLKEQALDSEKQNEIALQWDLIETELHDDDLWYFLTKGENTGYQTRIDLVLDLIAGTSSTDKEKYATFFHFARETNLSDQWEEIHKTFLLLKDWYEDHELYHKIGYLIASESCSLKDIYDDSKDKTKKDFKKDLNEKIRESIQLKEKDKNYADLSYTNQTDCEKISKLLLLFNVESVRLIDNDERNNRQNDEEKSRIGTQRFPFRIYKAKQWSLEHIHAQQSEGLNKQEEWKEWLDLHKDYVNDELKEEIKERIKAGLTKTEYERLYKRVLEETKSGNMSENLHDISNLALLAKDTNSALSNSLFCVKRGKVIDYDNEGECIPLCTKRVFLKYYTKEKNQLDFWGPDDRKDYIEAINDVLKKYLGEENKIAIDVKNEG